MLLGAVTPRDGRARAQKRGQDRDALSENPQVTAPHLPRVIRTPRTALLLLALCCTALASCGGGSDASSRVDQYAQADSLWTKDQPPQAEQLDAPPETYGLPPLDVLQANPGAVAQQLFRRAQASTWTVRWDVRRDGKDLGDAMAASIPPGGEGGARLFITGTFGLSDKVVARFDLLDRGEGPRVCIQVAMKPIVCDTNLSELSVDMSFMSMQGFAKLQDVLRDALAFPGLSVQYVKIAGEPATCFFLPPVQPTSKSTAINVSFTKPGSFCLSREGAILKLEFDQLLLIATEYRNTANPDMFHMIGDAA